MTFSRNLDSRVRGNDKERGAGRTKREEREGQWGEREGQPKARALVMPAPIFMRVNGSRHPVSFPMISELISKRKLFSAPSNKLRRDFDGLQLQTFKVNGDFFAVSFKFFLLALNPVGEPGLS